MNGLDASTSMAAPPATRFGGVLKLSHPSGGSFELRITTTRNLDAEPAVLVATTGMRARPAATPVTVTVEPFVVTVAFDVFRDDAVYVITVPVNAEETSTSSVSPTSTQTASRAAPALGAETCAPIGMPTAPTKTLIIIERDNNLVRV